MCAFVSPLWVPFECYGPVARRKLASLWLIVKIRTSQFSEGIPELEAWGRAASNCLLLWSLADLPDSCVCVCVCVCERERERERDRQTERERDR